MKLNIITRCTRPQNLVKLKESLQTDLFEVVWYILIDTSIVKEIDTETITSISGDGVKISFLQGLENDFGHQMINKAIDDIKEGFIYILDDDNIIMNPKFFERINEEILANPDKQGFVFSQKVAGKDFTGLDIREACEENMKVQRIDFSQFVLDRRLWAGYRLIKYEYKADGYFIEKLFYENRDKFHFIKEVLCYYNYLLVGGGGAKVPRVLYIGDDEPALKSEIFADYESDKLYVKYRKDDKDIIKDLYEFDPDAIVSVVKDYNKLEILNNLPLQVRQKWINVEKGMPGLGEAAYRCSMIGILNRDNKDLISYATPLYNIGEKLWETYKSLKEQTFSNWEWVLVDDSNDNGKTYKVAQEISRQDPRVKLYSFKTKSGGIIGESKYRTFSMCDGFLIAEFDNDDIITPNCTEVLYKAGKKYPDVGFFYSDCCEIDDQGNSLQYQKGFAFGYGSYRTEIFNGKEYQVSIATGVNPKTCRHIVGMGNHIRCWSKNLYFKINGHRRRLSIGDDYELMVRSFLNTRMMHIPKLLYFQHIHNSGSNAHNRSRSLIQKHVRFISDYYNERINKRFTELGLKDWAYENNRNSPLSVASRFGYDEQAANLTFED